MVRCPPIDPSVIHIAAPLITVKLEHSDYLLGLHPSSKSYRVFSGLGGVPLIAGAPKVWGANLQFEITSMNNETVN